MAWPRNWSTIPRSSKLIWAGERPSRNSEMKVEAMERALDEAEVARTLGDVLVANATRFPDKVVLFNDQGSYTHKAYFERVKRIAVGLYGRGVDRQDRVAFLMGNGRDILCLFGAAELAGYIAVPLNWRLATDEIE